MTTQPSYKMPEFPDILVDTRFRRRLLTVECIAETQPNPENAVHLRRVLVRLGRNVEGTYFLLVFPAALYLWEPASAMDALPSYSAPALSVFRTYLGKVADWPGGLRSENLRIAIEAWLSDLVGGLRTPSKASEPDQMLLTSGVYDQIKDGYVQIGFDA